VGLTVAVTGPTGDIGISAVEALQLAPEVERIIGMARRPFDPAGPHVSPRWSAACEPHVGGDGHREAKSQLGWTPKYTAAETLSAWGEAI